MMRLSVVAMLMVAQIVCPITVVMCWKCTWLGELVFWFISTIHLVSILHFVIHGLLPSLIVNKSLMIKSIPSADHFYSIHLQRNVRYHSTFDCFVYTSGLVFHSKLWALFCARKLRVAFCSVYHGVRWEMLIVWWTCLSPIKLVFFQC